MRGFVARYACPLAAGVASFQLVVDEVNYELASLSGKARNQTRRGLENCTVRQVAIGELEGQGALRLSRDTLERQGGTIATSHDSYWRQYLAAAADTRTMEAWGAYCEGNLASFLIACRLDDCMNVLIVRSHRDWLKRYPNNAMVYTFTREAIARDFVSQVSFGLASLRAGLEKLDHFKEGMGYVRRPIGQRIELHPLLRVAARTPLLGAIRRFAEHRSQRPAFGKIAGMLRWYSEQPPLKAAG
jgi:hypothetical protein